MYSLLAGDMRGKWGMMESGGKYEHISDSPFFIIGLIFHVAMAVLFFFIMLFLAMYLWEKVKSERYSNRKLQKGK